MGNKIGYLLLIIFFTSCNSGCPDDFGVDSFKNTDYEYLCSAVIDEDTVLIEKLLLNQDLNINYKESDFGNTLLHLALINSKKKSALKLLKLGADVSILNKNDKSPLMSLLRPSFTCNCQPDLVELLLKFGANPNENYKHIENLDSGIENKISSSPLIFATKQNCLSSVKILVENGAKIDELFYDDGFGAIRASITQDNLSITKYFIIDQKAKLPYPILIREQVNEWTPADTLSVLDYLNEKVYEKDTENYKYKREIIEFIEEMN